MRPCSNRFAAIFLAVFLLFVQQGASLHALSHAAHEVADSGRAGPEKQSPGGHENCEQCLSFAAAGAALPGHQTVALPDFTHTVSAAVLLVLTAVRTTFAYLSRAPPQVLL